MSYYFSASYINYSVGISDNFKKGNFQIIDEKIQNLPPDPGPHQICNGFFPDPDQPTNQWTRVETWIPWHYLIQETLRLVSVFLQSQKTMR